MQSKDELIDLKPYMKNGMVYILANWFHDRFFQPIIGFLESLREQWTARWVSKSLAQIPIHEAPRPKLYWVKEEIQDE